MQVSSTTSQIDPYRYFIKEQSVSTASFAFEKENSYTQEQHSSKNTHTDNYTALLASFRSTQSAQYTITQEQARKDKETSEVTDTVTEQVDENSVKTTKDQEQFDLAMEAFGLSPEDTKDVFTMELMQEGYTLNQAKERASIYHNAGLLANEEGYTNITMGQETLKVYHLSMASFDPVYKESLREAFDQMDNEQLKKSKIQTGLSIHVNDLKEIMPKDGSKSQEEVWEGLQEYYNEKYGTSEKIFDLFDKILHKIKMEEKFTGTKLTDERESIELFMKIYEKNRNT